jgi:hypothetical protein
MDKFPEVSGKEESWEYGYKQDGPIPAYSVKCPYCVLKGEYCKFE